jgi:NAD(P)H-flavin reductase
MSQKATVSLDASGFIRVAIPATFTWAPGQHCFLRFTSFGVLQAVSSHPFTICSSPSMDPDAQSELVFYIRPHSGFTAKLHAHALAHPNSSIRVLVDGPYGGITPQNFTDSDHALVIAGGSGAGWCLPYVEHFLRVRRRSYDTPFTSNDTSEIEKGLHKVSKTTSLRVVLATRDAASRMWFLGAVDALRVKYNTSESLSDLRVDVHLTGKADVIARGSDDVSDSSLPDKQAAVANQDRLAGEFEGRPQLPAVVKEEADLVKDEGRVLSVFVCGPSTMLNDVRNAVAAGNLRVVRGDSKGGIYMYAEHFEWT